MELCWGSMKIIGKKNVIVHEDDQKLSVKTIMLLDDFPPISIEDHHVIIAEYIVAYYKEIRVLISWDRIPDKIGEPLKPKRMRKAGSEDVKEEPQKPTKKAKVVRTATFEILPTRTRGGASTRASPA